MVAPILIYNAASTEKEVGASGDETCGGCSDCVCATTQPTNSPGLYPENYEALVKEWIRTSLYDPYSVRDLSITEPKQGRAWRGLLVGGPFNAWATCVTYNAKNQMGGYVGLGTTVVWILDGAIVGSEPYDSGAGTYPLGRGPHSEYTCA